MIVRRARDASEFPRDVPAEAALWRELQGDPTSSARQVLFDRYLDLAQRMARLHYRNIRGGGFELADVRQLAVEGLLQAIDLFDSGRGSSFTPYARHRIRGRIIDGIAQSSEFHQQISFRNRTEYERTRSLSADEQAPLTAAQAMRLLAEVATGLALGIILEGSRLYVRPDEAEPSPSAYDTLAWRDTVRSVHQAVSDLPNREGRLIRLHYLEGVSFDAVAVLFQLSKGRVSQIHKRALGLLRESLSLIDGGPTTRGDWS